MRPRHPAEPPVAAPGPVRERIVRAAEECWERYGPGKTTVEDIAAAARVSRTTVYRHFPGGRDEVIATVVLGTYNAFLAGRFARLPDEYSVPDVIVDVMLEAIDYVRARPHLAVLVSPETVGYTSGAFRDGAATTVIDLCLHHARPFFDRARAAGQLRPELVLEDAVEIIVRMFFSLITMPGPSRTDDETRRFLRTFASTTLLPDHAGQRAVQA